MKTMPFTFGGNLVIPSLDGFEVEIEIGPENYRALYEQDHHGYVTRLQFERNEARPKQPDYWVPDAGLPLDVRRAIERQIIAEYREEQRRMTEQYDEAEA